MRLVRYIVPALLALATLGAPLVSHAQGIGISINLAPPGLPVYEQPVIPAPGYLWIPGYWAWADGDYYWVPGTWVEPPQVGLLWTPGYWGFVDGNYVWNAGYWGPQVGFYGGINYGFGYTGAGYYGGRWEGGVFAYNRAYNHIDPSIVHNVYIQQVHVSNTARTSFNGPGGVTRRPTAEEERAAQGQHVPATAAQTQHEHVAATTPALHYSANHGKPAVAATAKPGELSGKGVVPAKAAGAPPKKPAATPAASLQRHRRPNRRRHRPPSRRRRQKLSRLPSLRRLRRRSPPRHPRPSPPRHPWPSPPRHRRRNLHRLRRLNRHRRRNQHRLLRRNLHPHQRPNLPKSRPRRSRRPSSPQCLARRRSAEWIDKRLSRQVAALPYRMRRELECFRRTAPRLLM